MLQQIIQFFSRTDFPTRDEINWVQSKNTCTPDLSFLEQYEFQRLFVPDDMKVGFSKHSLISSDSERLAIAFTREKFQMWEYNNGKERASVAMEAVESSLLAPALVIQGELHKIKSSAFRELDIHRDNTRQYLRKRVQIVVPYREHTPPEEVQKYHPTLRHVITGNGRVISPEKVGVMKAWMYVANPDYWADRIDGGYLFKPTNHFKPNASKKWLTEYYEYLKNEKVK